MSVETFDHAKRAAADIIRLDLDELYAATETNVHFLGNLSLNSIDGHIIVPAWRAYAGPEELVGKGGIRMTDELEIEDPLTELPPLTKELPSEMFGKIGLYGLAGYKGAKGIIGINPNSISFDDRKNLMSQYAERMVDLGLAGHTKDIPAGDMGTNGLSDIYASKYGELTKDPHWQASITGKSVAYGGLDLRPSATGLGVWAALEYEIAIAREEAPSNYVHTVKLQGFGNVGSHFGYYVGQNYNTSRLMGISDRDGTLVVEGEYQGMIITEEIVQTIGDNPAFRGDKLPILKELLEKNQPKLRLRLTDDPQDIYAYDTDWFVPAAAPDVINRKTVEQLTKTTKYGVIEAGNGVTTPTAHNYLQNNGRIIVPDIAANGLGIQASVIELNENRSRVTDPAGHQQISNEATYEQLINASNEVMRKLHRIAEYIQTPDLRIAAAVILETQLAEWQGLTVDAPNIS